MGFEGGLYWHQAACLGLAALPALLALLAWLGRRRRLAALGDAHLRPWFLQQQPIAAACWGQRLGLIVVWLALSLALAGPRWPSAASSQRLIEDVQLVAIVDWSASMRVRDGAAPSGTNADRLSQALGLLKAWSDQPPKDGYRLNWGLIGFAGQAHVFWPVSSDAHYVASQWQGLASLTLPSYGNDLAAALKQAPSLFSSQAGVRRVLLLSDGDLGEPAQEAAIKALETWPQDLDISLSVVGLGGSLAQPVPDGASGWLKVDSQAVLSARDAGFLRRLASASNAQQGEHYWSMADIDATTLEQPLNQLLGLPPKRLSASQQSQVVWEEGFVWPLSLALVVLSALMLCPLWKRYRQRAV